MNPVEILAVTKIGRVLHPLSPQASEWVAFLAHLPRKHKQEAVPYIAGLCVGCLREGIFRGRVPASAPVGYKVFIGWIISTANANPILN